MSYISSGENIIPSHAHQGDALRKARSRLPMTGWFTDEKKSWFLHSEFFSEITRGYPILYLPPYQWYISWVCITTVDILWKMIDISFYHISWIYIYISIIHDNPNNCEGICIICSNLQTAIAMRRARVPKVGCWTGSSCEAIEAISVEVS